MYILGVPVAQIHLTLFLSQSIYLSLSLNIRPNHPLLLVGPLNDIKLQHIADEYKSLLVGHKWCVHTQDSSGELR